MKLCDTPCAEKASVQQLRKWPVVNYEKAYECKRGKVSTHSSYPSVSNIAIQWKGKFTIYNEMYFRLEEGNFQPAMSVYLGTKKQLRSGFILGRLCCRRGSQF